jgi:hypothetical protein
MGVLQIGPGLLDQGLPLRGLAVIFPGRGRGVRTSMRPPQTRWMRYRPG